MKQKLNQPLDQRGVFLVMSLLAIIFITTIAITVSELSINSLRVTERSIAGLNARMGADAGAQIALNEVNLDEDYQGTDEDGDGIYGELHYDEVNLYVSPDFLTTYVVDVSPGVYGATEKIVEATGRVYFPATKSPANLISERKVKVTLQSSSSSFEHTLQTGNGPIYMYGNVNISGTFFSNDQILLQDGAVRLSGNIKAAGRDNSTDNCSINGNGRIVSSTVNTRYLICGVNTTDVTATENDTSVEPKPLPIVNKASILDGITADEPCSTLNNPSGGQPYDVISAHYPNDDASGTSSGCNVNLRSNRAYEVSDHFHVRGNFNADRNTIITTGTDDIYAIVEGEINLDRTSVVGTAPIIFVSYSTIDSNGDKNAENAIDVTGNNLSLNAYFLAPDGSIGYAGRSSASSGIGAMAAQSIVIKGSGASTYIDVYPSSIGNRVWGPLYYQRDFN